MTIDHYWENDNVIMLSKVASFSFLIIYWKPIAVGNEFKSDKSEYLENTAECAIW